MWAELPGRWAALWPANTANMIERLLRWTTVHSEHLLNGTKRKVGPIDIANEDGGAHGVVFITQSTQYRP